jgi:hypothetical protein
MCQMKPATWSALKWVSMLGYSHLRVLMTECLPEYDGSTIYQWMPCSPCCTRHWWDEDVAAFEAELNTLKKTGDGGKIIAHLSRKKDEVKAITDVSSTWLDVDEASMIVILACPYLCSMGGQPQCRSYRPIIWDQGKTIWKVGGMFEFIAGRSSAGSLQYKG